MTATITASDRLAQLKAQEDQLKAEMAALQADAALETLRNSLAALSTSVGLMLDALSEGNLDAVRLVYQGSTQGMFYGPITEVKKAMSKLK